MCTLANWLQGTLPQVWMQCPLLSHAGLKGAINGAAKLMDSVPETTLGVLDQDKSSDVGFQFLS